jgi:hypothetical protein
MTFIPDWKIADDGWPVLALAGIVTILTSMIFLPLGCFFLGIMMWLAHWASAAKPANQSR